MQQIYGSNGIELGSGDGSGYREAAMYSPLGFTIEGKGRARDSGEAN